MKVAAGRSSIFDKLIVANAVTPSYWERVVWLPVDILFFASSLVVARS